MSRPRPLIHHIELKLRCVTYVTYTLYTALFGLLIYSHIQRSGGPSYSVLALQITPLLIFLPGMLQKHYRTFSWLCFVLLFYFIKAVEGVFTSNATLSDSVFLWLIVGLFISAMLHSRWLQYVKVQKVSAQKPLVGPA